MLLSLRNVSYRESFSPTVGEAAEEWLRQVRAGEVRNRSGRTYKPSVIRSYETSLRLHVLPSLGEMKVKNVRLRDIQDLAERLSLVQNPSTVRNAMNPLRAIFRRALLRGVVSTNPTVGLALPALDGRRDRIATPREAENLLAVLSTEDQALWGTAFYAGLRLGEIRALTTVCLDLEQAVIHVQHSFDTKSGLIAPKSASGKRTVPMPSKLKDLLARHLETRTSRSRFVFAEAGDRPFRPGVARRRARAAWKKQGLVPIGFHEARHTYATICIAAGLDAKRLSTFMGHSSIATTYDLYGHLFPGSERESAAVIDAFLVTTSRASPTPCPTPPQVEIAK